MELVHRFGRFEVRPLQRQLLVDGEETKLGSRAFDVLITLIEQRDRLVTKHELLDAVWPGLVVEENNLVVQIGTLRKLLGAQVIATIPGRGYRFTALAEAQAAAVSSVDGAGAGSAARFSPRSNLPEVLPALIGRDDDLAALGALLDAHRLITIVGAGGMGKTRLAERLLHQRQGNYEQGVAWVELAGLSDRALLGTTIAGALGLKADSGNPIEGLVAALRPLSMALALDNAEHLIDEVAIIAQALHDGAPRLRLIVTSQAPMKLSAERVYRLGALAVPEADVPIDEALGYGAVALFVERARAADRHFELTAGNLASVIQVCAQLDGLALALELAAARVPMLGVVALAAALDERLHLLTQGRRGAPQRQRTLRAALEWSHGLLNAAEATVFRRLGVFAGGFSLDMARQVVADEITIAADATPLDAWAVVDALGSLIDRSFVAADTGTLPRYRLLESARSFALERLAAAGETALTLRRHALAVCDFLGTVDDAFLDGELLSDQHTALARPNLDNVRAAYSWASDIAGDPQIAITLAARASAVEDFALECAPWLLTQRQQVDAGVNPALAARYWLGIADPAMFSLFTRPAQVEAAHCAVRLYQALGQARRVYFGWLLVARHQNELNNDEAASQAIEQARCIVQPEWSARLRVRLLRMDSYAARRAHRLPEALQLFREVARVCVQAGDWGPEIGARNVLADLLWEIGPIEEAAQEACELAEQLRTRPASVTDTALVFSNVVGILSEMGNVEGASRAARESLPFMPRAKQYFLDVFVHLLWRRKQYESAVLLLGASEAVIANHQAPRQPNEQRLIDHARPALEAALAPDAFARCFAAGSVLSEAGWHAVVAQALSESHLPASQ